MSLQRTILLVSPTPSMAKSLSSHIRRMGHRLVVAKTFDAAKRHLIDLPHLLVTELKLGAYNGLHLALRAGATAIPALVIANESFEHEVEQVGAVRVSEESVASDDFGTQVIRALQGVGASHAAFPWYDDAQDDQRHRVGLTALRPATIRN